MDNNLINDSEIDDDDDAIYTALNWEESPTQAAITAAIVVFVAGPIIFTVLWMLSLYPRRPYVQEP
jgi:hypothetical protein